MAGRSNRQRAAALQGEDTGIYANDHVIRSMQAPNTAGMTGNSDTASSKAVAVGLGLGLLVLLLLVGIIGLLYVHFARDESEEKVELSHLKATYTNLTEERDQIKAAYTNLTEERDQIKAAYTNLSNRHHSLIEERDRLKNRNKILDEERANGVCKDCWVKAGGLRSLYYISTEEKDWESSRQDCQDRGADLVVINSEAEQKCVASFDKRVWIGLTDQVEEGEWKWVDGTPLTKSYWDPIQPDNKGDPDEDCVEIYNHPGDPLKKWNDLSCSHTNHFICEISF